MHPNHLQIEKKGYSLGLGFFTSCIGGETQEYSSFKQGLGAS